MITPPDLLYALLCFGVGVYLGYRRGWKRQVAHSQCEVDQERCNKCGAEWRTMRGQTSLHICRITS